MNNPDNLYQYKNTKLSLYKVRQTVAPLMRQAIETLCIAISEENEERYKQGQEMLKPFAYVDLLFKEMICKVYLDKHANGWSKAFEDMAQNRGTGLKYKRKYDKLHEGEQHGHN